MGMVKNFLDANPDAGVIYFESESAITKQMVIDRGIDPTKNGNVSVTTVQEFRTQAIKLLDKYLEQNEADRKPIMLCLDSHLVCCLLQKRLMILLMVKKLEI